jgi:hypothetical protein
MQAISRILGVALATIALAAGTAEARGHGGGHHSSNHRSSSHHSRTYHVRHAHYRSHHAGSHHANSHYYTNVDGNRVHRPVHASSAPSGASAQCRDGSYSFSQHRQGTCSHHGGVASWR